MRKFCSLLSARTALPWLSTPRLTPGPSFGFALVHRARFLAICVHPCSSTTISVGLRPPAKLTPGPHAPGSRRLSTQERLRPPRRTRRADLARSQLESHVRGRSPARRIKRFVVASSVPRTWDTFVGCTVDRRYVPPSNRISGKRNVLLARRPWGLSYGRARALRLAVVPFRLDVASLVLP